MAIPSNLLPINNPFRAEVEELPTISPPSILNTVIPDRLFTTGSIDQVRARTLNAASTYTGGLPALPTLPTVNSFIPSRPRIPSYGQIKNYIKTKIDRIKQRKQQASVKALDSELKKQENPFKYRQSLKNQETKSTVLGRFNNQ